MLCFSLHNFCNLKQNLGLGFGFCLFTLIKRLNQCLARGISLIWNELENYGVFFLFFSKNPRKLSVILLLLFGGYNFLKEILQVCKGVLNCSTRAGTQSVILRGVIAT